MNYNNQKILNTNTTPLSIGPYSQIIEIKNIIFISGQIPINPDTMTIPDNIYDQTHQALQNIKTLLNSINLKIENIVKITLFIKNIHDLQIINNSYKKFFDMHSLNPIHNKLPTRSCVEVSKLPRDSKIEIEGIAMRF